MRGARTQPVLLSLIIAGLAAFGSPDAPAQSNELTLTPAAIISNAVGAEDVELSRFGSFVAIYDTIEGNSIRLFNASLEEQWRRRLPHYWAGSLDAGSIIQFAPDESFVLFPGARTENDICVCSVETGEPVAVLREHEEDVAAIALSPDGNLLVSASSNELLLWEREGDGFALLSSVRNYEPRVQSIEFLPGGEQVAMSTRGQTERALRLVDVSAGRVDEVFAHSFTDNNITHDIYQIAVSPDGASLAPGYSDSLLLVQLNCAASRLVQQLDDI